MKKMKLLLLLPVLLAVAAGAFVFSACSARIERITVDVESRSFYFVGDTANDLDGYVIVHYTNGNERRVPLSDPGVTASGYDFSSLTEAQDLTVNYRGHNANFRIRIVPVAPMELVIHNARTEYFVNHAGGIDRNQGTIDVIYNDARVAIRTIPFTTGALTFVGQNFSAVVDGQLITVVYRPILPAHNNQEYLTASYQINIVDGDASIAASFEGGANNATIRQNEVLPDIYVSVVRHGGAVSTPIPFNPETMQMGIFNQATGQLTQFDNLAIGDHTLSVIYRDFRTTLPVRVNVNNYRNIRIALEQLAGVEPSEASEADLNTAIEIAVLRGGYTAYITEEDMLPALNIILYSIQGWNEAAARTNAGRHLDALNNFTATTPDEIEEFADAAAEIVRHAPAFLALLEYTVIINGQSVNSIVAPFAMWFTPRAGVIRRYNTIMGVAIQIYRLYEGLEFNGSMLGAHSVQHNIAYNLLMDNSTTPTPQARNIMFYTLERLELLRPHIFDFLCAYAYYSQDNFAMFNRLTAIYVPVVFAEVYLTLSSARSSWLGLMRTLLPPRPTTDITVETSLFLTRMRSLDGYINALLAAEESHPFFVYWYWSIPSALQGLSVNQDGTSVPLVMSSMHQMRQLFRYGTGLRETGNTNDDGNRVLANFTAPFALSMSGLMGDMIHSQTFSEFLHMYLDLRSMSLLAAAEFEQNIEDGTIGDMADELLRLFVSLPATYQLQFYFSTNILYGANITGGTQGWLNFFFGWAVSDFFAIINSWHYARVLDPTLPATQVGPEGELFRMLLVALEYNIWAVNGFFDDAHEVFLEYVEDDIIPAYEALSDAARDRFDLHLGFLYEKIMELLEIRQQIEAEDYSPDINAYWSDIADRLFGYLESGFEAYRRINTSIVPGEAANTFIGFTDPAFMHLLASYIRANRLVSYAIREAKDCEYAQAALDAFTFYDTFVIGIWTPAAGETPAGMDSTPRTLSSLYFILRGEAVRWIDILGRRNNMSADVWNLLDMMYEAVWLLNHSYAVETLGMPTMDRVEALYDLDAEVIVDMFVAFGQLSVSAEQTLINPQIGLDRFAVVVLPEADRPTGSTSAYGNFVIYDILVGYFVAVYGENSEMAQFADSLFRVAQIYIHLRNAMNLQLGTLSGLRTIFIIEMEGQPAAEGQTEIMGLKNAFNALTGPLGPEYSGLQDMFDAFMALFDEITAPTPDQD